ncbi:hypothetical protein KK083_32295, partial [Fulvivirgaceae bacterium PWU4]
NSTYTPSDLQARNLEDHHALRFMSTLDRYRKFENDSHQEAMDLLTKRIKDVLNIENPDPDQRRFLQTVLQDYVILSR